MTVSQEGHTSPGTRPSKTDRMWDYDSDALDDRSGVEFKICGVPFPRWAGVFVDFTLPSKVSFHSECGRLMSGFRDPGPFRHTGVQGRLVLWADTVGRDGSRPVVVLW